MPFTLVGHGRERLLRPLRVVAATRHRLEEPALGTRQRFGADQQVGTAEVLSTFVYTAGTQVPSLIRYQVVECGSGPV